MPNPTGAGGFRAGQSGNPAGRPKVVADVRALAQKHTKAAIEGLLDVAKDKTSPAAARVAAWNAILDRAVGKPPATLAGEGGEGVAELAVRWLGQLR